MRPALAFLSLAVRTRLLILVTWMDLAAALVPRSGGVSRSRWPSESFVAEWIRAEGVGGTTGDGGAVLYLHGGAFIAGGLRTHRSCAIRISRATRRPVLHVAYRQLPRYNFSTSVADAFAAYEALLGAGFAAQRITIAGDSSGAYVALALMLRARGRGLALPSAAALMSPFVDLDLTAPLPVGPPDPILSKTALARVARLVRISDPEGTAISPAQSDLTGLPPTLIQVGSTELLRPSVRRLAENLAAHGVQTHLEIWDGQVHMFQRIGGALLPEAKRAICEVGDFLRTAMDLDQIESAS